MTFPNVAIWIPQQVRLGGIDVIVTEVEMIARDRVTSEEDDCRDGKLVIPFRLELTDQMRLAMATLTFWHTGILAYYTGLKNLRQAQLGDFSTNVEIMLWLFQQHLD